MLNNQRVYPTPQMAILMGNGWSSSHMSPPSRTGSQTGQDCQSWQCQSWVPWKIHINLHNSDWKMDQFLQIWTWFGCHIEVSCPLWDPNIYHVNVRYWVSVSIYWVFCYKLPWVNQPTNNRAPCRCRRTSLQFVSHPWRGWRHVTCFDSSSCGGWTPSSACDESTDWHSWDLSWPEFFHWVYIMLIHWTYLRAAAPAADPGSKYGGLATFGYLLKQGNSLYQLKKHTQLHPASRRFRGAIFEEAGPLGIGILLVQQVAKCSWSTIRDSGQLRCNT
jgi:hypothetical protein